MKEEGDEDLRGAVDEEEERVAAHVAVPGGGEPISALILFALSFMSILGHVLYLLENFCILLGVVAGIFLLEMGVLCVFINFSYVRSHRLVKKVYEYQGETIGFALVTSVAYVIKKQDSHVVVVYTVMGTIFFFVSTSMEIIQPRTYVALLTTIIRRTILLLSDLTEKSIKAKNFDKAGSPFSNDWGEDNERGQSGPPLDVSKVS